MKCVSEKQSFPLQNGKLIGVDSQAPFRVVKNGVLNVIDTPCAFTALTPWRPVQQAGFPWHPVEALELSLPIRRMISVLRSSDSYEWSRLSHTALLCNVGLTDGELIGARLSAAGGTASSGWYRTLNPLGVRQLGMGKSGLQTALEARKDALPHAPCRLLLECGNTAAHVRKFAKPELGPTARINWDRWLPQWIGVALGTPCDATDDLAPDALRARVAVDERRVPQ